jgi:hypothetical protein
MSTVEFVKTNRGKDQVLYKGYLFYYESSEGGTDKYRCKNYQRNCKARVHLEDGDVVKIVGEHNHAASAAKVEATKVMTQIKEDAKKENPKATQQIIAENLVGLNNPVLASLPLHRSVARLVRKVKQNNQPDDQLPAIPETLKDLQIPAKFAEFQDGTNFIIHDSGDQDPERFIIFGTDEGLQKLQNSDEWYVDGNFKCPFFKQLWVIHGTYKNSIFPGMYCCLMRQNEETYKRVLDAVIADHPQLVTKLSRCHMDFETAAINAFTSIKPEIKINGCFFHFTQAIYRNVCSLGFKTNYDTDSDFAAAIKLLPAIAFVPSGDVITTFELIQDRDLIPDKALPILNYFEDTWIGRPGRRGRAQPMFSHNWWNCYEPVKAGFGITNNRAEAFFRQLTHDVTYKKDLWGFLDALHRNYSKQKMIYEQLIAGDDGNPQRKTYRNTEKRRKDRVNSYEDYKDDEDNLMAYIRGHSYNIELSTA